MTMPEITPWSDLVETATEFLRQADPVMAKTIDLVGPCTLTTSPDIFEALIDSIISQQISVKAADAIVQRVRDGVPNHVLTPEAVNTLDFDGLRAAGLSSPKARYVRHLTDLVVSGDLNLTALPSLEDEEVIKRLTEVKGIGRWTAEMILIFSLGRPDVLPVDDLGFVEGVRSAYGLPERPNRKEMLARGEAWRPYRTFATWYMWAWRRNEQKNTRERTRIVSL